MRYGGRIHTGWMAFVGSVVVFGGLVGLLLWSPEAGRPAEALVVYCAASQRGPMEAAARAYERAEGVPIEMVYGGSQTLLSQAELSGKGDLYLPADDQYIEWAREKGLVAETVDLAVMRPVVGVRRGNPKRVGSIEDLLRPDIRLALANPDAAAIGLVTREALSQRGVWKRVERHAAVFKPTVMDVANDVKLGTADAALVWDVVIAQYPELEGVELAELAGHESRVRVAVLRGSKRVEEARRLARYLGSAEGGLKEFEKAGFRTVQEQADGSGAGN